MDSHHGQQAPAAHRCGRGGEIEPTTTARSRWAPKPEQILILESIFNSGMVNPAKDETARIRRLIERFGAVRDANVFYWFQNRRSRSRRRARQLQQACGGANPAAQLPSAAAAAAQLHGFSNGASHYVMHGHASARTDGTGMPTSGPVPPSSVAAAAPRFFGDDVDGGGDDLFAISRQMGLMTRGEDHHRCGYMANDTTQLSYHYQPQPAEMTTASIQVFINGVVYDVPGGEGTLLDLAGTFGRDAVLVHSSGEILPVNEHGVLMKSLQMGESYYLVFRST